MAATVDEGIASAVTTANTLLEDEEIRARMEAREDYYRRQRTERSKMAREKARNKELQLENESLRTENETLQTENETLQTENETLQAEIERLRKLLAER